MEKLKISVIIPTYNRENCLLTLLNNLFKQDYSNFEIIVIDQSDHLSEGKRKIIGSKNLRYFHIAERGRSLAKNYGIIVSTGQIVLFCDDDIEVPVNFISTHVRNYSNPLIGGVSCRLVEEGQPSLQIKPALKITYYGKLINKPYSTLSQYATSLNGGNMSIRKNVLTKIGFFEEHFIGTSMVEEPDLAYRITENGYKIFFDASITVWHHPQYNGNIATMNHKRAEWFHDYFNNLLMFYTKYGRFFSVFIASLYALLVLLKHAILYSIPVNLWPRMASGISHGISFGRKLFNSNKKNLLFTPVRNTKQIIKEING